ncbi:hypothetical protein BGW37DRAFT_551960 [Umbelopsis sp. PMI_123]|nr:hypothetical protein BGW37DRAFT_551960 [Umbelopsis sp. PMI_123]
MSAPPMSEPMKWYFHAETSGVHFLFAPLYLDSPWKLLIAYVIIIAICWAERALTFKLDTIVYKPYGNRIGTMILRTLYYGVATTLRLLYMLIAMYFNTGLFLVLVMALTTGQLVIEYKKSLRTARASLGELTSRSVPLQDDPSQGSHKSYHDNADEEEQQLFAVDDDEYSTKQNNRAGQI